MKSVISVFVATAWMALASCSGTPSGETQGEPIAQGCGDSAVTSAQTLETDEQVAAMLGEMSLEEKTIQMSGFTPGKEIFKTPDNERLGIRGFYFRDGPHGVRMDDDGTATCFPAPVSRGASWDLDLEERVGEAIGKEVEALGHNVILAPCVNTLRHPAWGRAQETYGEDPWFLGKMGAAFTRGAQKTVPACAKHVAGNNTEDNRETHNALIDEQNLRENYMRQYRMIIEEGDVACVMAAYNKVNDHYACENDHLLRDILKNEWGFDGFVVSDWYAAHSTVGSITAGLDVEMPWRAHYAELDQAVKDGEVDEALIDDAVTRILRVKYKFGFADMNTPIERDPGIVESTAHTDLAREAARKGMVLLKNEGTALPLDPTGSTGKKIAVVGPWADIARLGDNGSSRVTTSYAITPFGGISKRVEGMLEVGTSVDSSAAEGADIAIVIAALTPEDEGEAWNGGGDRDTLDLSKEHEDLINEVSQMVETTIVVIEAGGPITMERWASNADAIVMAWYPGMEGGAAMAELLFGDHNFEGRLIQTWPRKLADTRHFGNDEEETEFGFFHGYRYFDQQDLEPLFPFGYGLSYTTFEYSNLQISCDKISPDGEVVASIDVENTGEVAGVALPQFYIGYPNTTARRPKMELKSFARVELNPGEKQSAQVTINMRDIAYYDTDKSAWVVEHVAHSLRAGPDARDLAMSASFTVVGSP